MTNPVFIPGPTNMPEVLRKACDIPTMDHRSSAFADILHPARAGVQAVLQSKTAEVFILPGTGTLGWEAAVTNTLNAGDTVLIGRNGMFSHRWIDLLQRHGLDVIVLDTAWGNGLPTDRYAEVLAGDTEHSIKAVFATHNETATGVVSDIAGVRKAMDAANHPALLMVDGVSSIGSMPFKMDEWGVDIAVTGSQKGFMLPAGLAILGVSARAMGAMTSATLPRTYADLADMEKAYGASAFPYTPPVGLMAGLKMACDMLLDEGLDNVFARHTRMATGVRAAVDAWGLKTCAAKPEWQSDTVTAILTPEGFDATAMVGHAAETYDVAFGTGLGEVAGKVFRIGHLGKLSEAQALSGLAIAEMCMVDMGLNIQLGSGVAAAQAAWQKPGTLALAAE